MLNRDEKALLNSVYVNNKLIDDVIVYNDTTWREKVNIYSETISNIISYLGNKL